MFCESILLALLAASAKALPATTTTFACNPAHSYPNGASCISTAGSLTLVTPSPATTTFACNPAHSYPNGASCISTAGSLTLVTPSPAASTTFACNPAHSYPNGASCISTAGSLTLVTPAPSSSATFACNPAHSYPNGASCISTAGSLTLVTPTSAASTTYLCNPAHSACATVSGQLVPATSAAAAASSKASAASTQAASAGETPAVGLTWTVENLSRYCSEDRTGCDYNFNLTASDNRPAQSCTVIRTNVKDAPVESWANIPCTTGSNINVSWGYSAQFGADHAFAVMTVVNEQEKAKAYFGVVDINGQPVTTAPSNPFGSGQYGNIGPQVVYLF